MGSFSSQKYWEDRYAEGGHSGSGSYGRLATFKADFINNFVEENKIRSAVEFGCGDGNQTHLLKIDRYVGLDVSKKIIDKCIKEFSGDAHKSFLYIDQDHVYDGLGLLRQDLSLSLDVIYHLVEDAVYKKYLELLFSSAEKFVIVYASNTTDKKMGNISPHVKHRVFVKDVEKYFPEWSLIGKKENSYPFKEDPENESFADFYIYAKTNV